MPLSKEKDVQKIYKYASLDSAISILTDSRLLLKNPSSFNDPFDTNIKRDPKDIKRVRKISIGFASITLLVQLTQDPKISDIVRKNPSFKFAQLEYQTMVKALKKYPRFDGNIGFTTLFKIVGMKSSDFKERAEQTFVNLEKTIEEGTKRTRQQALVTCFSKTYKSILMWSHYSDSHAGVCIEYDRPDLSDFVDVIYKKQRPKLKLADLVSFVTAETIVGEDYNHQLDQKLISTTMEPYLVKSDQWEYEQEVRCLITTISNSKNHIFENGSHYYQMPKPTKIYIGCRCRGKKMDELIKIAKKQKIKYIFLKEDNETFSLKEK